MPVSWVLQPPVIMQNLLMCVIMGLLRTVAGFDIVFQMYLLVRYCRSLEEGSFRGRSSGFLWMLLLGMIS